MTTMKWRPISEAPRDGRVVDVWSGRRRVTDAAWTEDETIGKVCWCKYEWNIDVHGDCWGIILPQPTHWMPLPEPPGGDDV